MEAPRPQIPDYELIKFLDRGSYGDVWLARSVTGLYRAVKVVWRDRFEDPQPYEREFNGLKEFAAISLLEPGQLALLHVGRGPDFFYYVMELADDADSGRDIVPERYRPNTLREVKARRGRLPASEVIVLAAELARALAGLHGRGLVHRDIKPSNVILVGGTPKLADIGLVAAASDALTFVGTEGYVPPEGPGSPPADVYSLGRMLYELATGLERRDYPTLPPDLATFPDRKELLELNAVIVRACEPDVKRRHRDAAAVLDDLLLLQAGKSVRRVRAAQRPLGGIPSSVALLALAAAVAAVAGFGLWRRSPVPAGGQREAGPATRGVSESRQNVLKARAILDDDLLAGRESIRLAEELCQQAVKVDVADGEAWATLARVSAEMIARYYDASTARRAALQAQADRAIQLLPQSAEAGLAFAAHLVDASAAAEAEKRLRQLSERFPRDPRIVRALANVLQQLGRTQEATQIRLHHPSFGGRDPRPLLDEAGRLVVGTPLEAEALVDRAQALAPSRAGYTGKLVLLFQWRGNLDEAREYVTQIPAHLLQEDRIAAYVARVWLWLGDGERAFAVLRNVPRDFFEEGGEELGFLPRQYLSGWALQVAGRPAGAQSEWRQALSVVDKRLASEPDRATCLRWRALLLALTGQREEAPTAWKLYLDLNGPTTVKAASEFFMAMGRYDVAINRLEWLSQNRPSAQFFAIGVRYCPWYAPIRDDPRVQRLIADGQSKLAQMLREGSAGSAR